MQVQRFAKCRPAAYPDKEAVLGDPDLLRTIPERWKRNAAACAALAATLAILASCSGAARGRGLAVPFFDRGGGRYQYELNVMGRFAPPKVITEDSAFWIIQEEAGKQGLRFEKTGKILKEALLPERSMQPDNSLYESPKPQSSLQLDGYDAALDIAYEYVSREDSAQWNSKNTIVTETAAIAQMKEDARELLKGLKGNTGNTIVAVFYDPADEIDGKKDFDQIQEDLRQQVRDFIAWLKAQEII